MKLSTMKYFMLSALCIALSSAALAQSVARANWPKILTLGVIPTDGDEETLKGFVPLEEYLTQKLGVVVQVKVSKDYASLATDMKDNVVDLGYFGPASYISAVVTAGAETMVKENATVSGTGYYSLIISKTGSGLNSISDLQDKKFALVDTKSTSGYLVPMVYFLRKGNIKSETFFKSMSYTGSHDNSIVAVSKGIVDAAAVSSLELQKSVAQCQVKNSDFNILWRSDPIPSGTIAAHKTLPPSLKAAVKAALLQYRGKTLNYLKLVGFVASKDSDYDDVRDLEAFRKQLQK